MLNPTIITIGELSIIKHNIIQTLTPMSHNLIEEVYLRRDNYHFHLQK